MGAYGLNVGDSAAIYNIRKYFGDEYDWKSVDVIKFVENNNNETYAIEKLNNFLKDCKCLIVGGGGLIEGAAYSSTHTRWKLPFNKKILDTINIPIYVVAVGINNFRLQSSLNEQGVNNLNELIKKSKIFSVRNDGSLRIVNNIIQNNKIEECPDPGLLSDFEFSRKNKITKGCFQPAFNDNPAIMRGRFINHQNLDYVLDFVSRNNLKVFPHTKKDFKIFKSEQMCFDKQYFIEQCKANNYDTIIQQYSQFDYSIAMRGHGQMIALAINLPSIYLSTQDKVIDFSAQNNLLKYTVDIRQKDWLEKLKDMNQKMLYDKNYLEEWYHIRDNLITNSKKQFVELTDRIKNDI